jgi:hypothetical protein
MNQSQKLEEIARHEKYKNYLDNFSQNNLLKEVICGKTNFEEELSKFYSVNIHLNIHRGGYYYTFNFDKKSEGKINQTPKDLADLVLPFSAKENFDITKLEYSLVIDDHHLNKQITFPKIITGTLFIATFFGTLITEMATAYFLFVKDTPTYYKIPLAIGGLAASGGLVYANLQILVKGMPNHKDSTGSYDEFLNLFNSCQKADYFVEHSYKQYFLEKDLLST